MSGVWAIVPVKPFSEAKSRLGPVLSEQERRALAQMLLQRSLGVLLRVETLERILVVSRDQEALDLARQQGVDTLVEQSRGLNPALRDAATHALGRGSGGIIVVASDLPMSTPADILAMLEDERDRAVAIAHDRHGSGTNALLLRPSGLIDFAFGPQSFSKHCSAARAAGIEPTIVYRPGLAFDLDRPRDLEDLASEGDPGISPAFPAS